MIKEQSIDALNTLIEINNDRIEGYNTASKETEDADLKTLFYQLGNTSKKCNDALINQVTTLGGKPIEGTKTTGKIYRIWMDFKAMVTGKDRTAILNSCEYGETVAIDAYDSVLNNNDDDLTAEQKTMLNLQLDSIKADYSKVKSLNGFTSVQ